LGNLERHVPRHAHDDLRADDHRIVYAESMALARQAYRAFLTTWEKRPPKVAASLRDASEDCSRSTGFHPVSGRRCGRPMRLNACTANSADA
jgi:transposase-like protein